MVYPNAFIVGVNKAGTTAVFNTLSRQQGVCASTTKETHFFDPLKYGKEPPPLTEYEEFFRPQPGDEVVLEATPGYFYGGEKIASRLREISVQGRAVIILREPGSRAFSWWRFCRTRLLLPQELSFEDYLNECSSRGLEPERNQEDVGWRGLSGGHYDQWLPQWQDTFGDDLLVVYSDDFVESGSAAMARVASHLRINLTEGEAGRDNVSVDIKNPTLQRLALKLNSAGERLWRDHPDLKKRLLRAYYRMNSRSVQEKMSDEARGMLSEHFEGSLSRLRGQLPNVPERWWAK